MQIVVNHLTRMRGDRICVAGIDPAQRQHVRPITSRTDELTRELLRENGGPLELAGVLDVGQSEATPDPPQVEDRKVQLREFATVHRLSDDEYLNFLNVMAEPDLETAFGPALERRGWKYSTAEGAGDASLAVVKARRRPRLEVGEYGNLTFRFNDPKTPAYVPVTDVRFVAADNSTIRTDVVRDVHSRLQRGVGVYVMFGLGRAFRPDGDDRARHWLQVNGLCLEDKPASSSP